MAKRRRHYRGLVAAPFGAIGIPNSSVNSHDVLTGALASVVGAVAARYLWNTFASDAVKAQAALADFASGGWPTIADDNIPAIGAAATGAALFFGQKKSNPGRAMGHAIGAAAAAIAFAKIDVDRFLPASFKGLVAVNAGGGGMRGLVLPDQKRQALRGLVLPSPASRVEAGSRWRLPAGQANLGRSQNAAMGAIRRRR